MFSNAVNLKSQKEKQRKRSTITSTEIKFLSVKGNKLSFFTTK
jgi:hypothetical protein